MLIIAKYIEVTIPDYRFLFWDYNRPLVECHRILNAKWVIEFKNEQDQYHRNDGPSVISDNGYQAWCIDNKLHREDGPAATWNDSRYDLFYLNNKKLTKEQFEDFRIMKALQDSIKEELKS